MKTNQVISKEYNLSFLVQEILREEETILQKLELEKIFTNVTSNPYGLKKFAENFYFIRYDFCRLNFIVGERCCHNEVLWSGLAKNLIEELGGKKGVSHNHLYRDFLSCVGIKSEDELIEPDFAAQFNQSWETFCRTSSVAEALSAIAIYEIFDKPDYQLLFNIMKNVGIPPRGLRFFQVHSVAEHFEMFEDTISWLMTQEGGEEAFITSKNFVFQTQQKMWLDLLESLTHVKQTVLI